MSYLGEEFNADIASTSADTTTMGDSARWMTDVTGTCAASQPNNALGGYLRMALTATASSCLTTTGRTIGTPQKIFQVGNLPVAVFKVRVSNTAATSDTFVGLMDSNTVAATNDLRPANGLYFWGSNAATGWVAEARNTSGTQTVLSACGGTISTSSFALLKIEVISSSLVHFYADSNASDGVQYQDCGTISTAQIPGSTTPLASEIYGIQTTAATNNIDVDYVRVWQDDNVADMPEQTDVSDLSTPPLTSDSESSTTTAGQVGIIDFTTVTSEDAIFNGDVYVHGTIYADKIKANEIEGLSIFTDQLASLQQKLAQTTSTTTNPNGTTDSTTIIQTATTTLNLSDGLTVGGDASFHGNVFFYKLVTFTEKTLFNNDVTFAAHINTDGAAPTYNLEAGAGDSSSSASIDGNDSSGSLNITAGNNTTAGKVISVTFNKPFAKAPRVILSAGNDQAANAKYYVQSTATGFTINVIDPLASGASLQFNYFVIQ
jgi:hypothetical protein